MDMEQDGPSEHPEEDKSRGVPRRADAHTDEKEQVNEGRNLDVKSDEVLAGPELWWRAADRRPCCCSKRHLCPSPIPLAKCSSHLCTRTGACGSHKSQLK